MKYNIGFSKADQIILDFLKENGFSEEASINRLYYKDGSLILDDRGNPFTDIIDYRIINGRKEKVITRIKNYNKLLGEILSSLNNTDTIIETQIRNNRICLVAHIRDELRRGR